MNVVRTASGENDEHEPGETPASKKTVALVLTVLAAIALAFAALGFGGIALIARGMKQTEAYRTALDYLRSRPEVVADLGEPIEDGFMPSGRIATNDAGGSADLAISLEGPKGKGSAHISLDRSGSGWTIKSARWGFAGRVTTFAGDAPGR